MMIQLNPPIELMTPKGRGICHFLIDYGIEDNLYWVVFIHDTGECWTYANPEIKACKNITMGRLLNNKSTEMENMVKNFYNEVIKLHKKSYNQKD